MKWPLVDIARFCQTGSGGTPSRNKPDYYGGNIPWVKSGELNQEVVSDTEERISEQAIQESSAKVVPAGAILVAMYGATVGKSALLGVDAATNQAICNIIPRPEVADTRYVWYALKHQLPYLLSQRVGGAQPNISQQIIKNTKIPLPTPSEQRRIVEILDQADNLRKLRVEADKKSERILPALFNKMFGDPATNPMGWETGILGDVIIDAAYGTSERASEVTTAGIPVLRMNNIEYWGRLNLNSLKFIENGNGQLDRYILKRGDILFNRTNSSDLVGKTGIWNNELEKAVPASYLIRVRVDTAKALPEYIWAYMNTPFMKQNLLNKARRAIGMANINAQEIRSFPLVLPDIKVQERFAEKLASINELAPIREAASSKAQELFNLLLQRAFSGTLTASWREAHMKELLTEMEQQAKYLNLPTDYLR